jgi:hypothetical protein
MEHEIRRRKLLALWAAIAVAVCVGCGGKGQPGLDVKALERSFVKSEPTIKATVVRAVAAAQEKDYTTAAAELAKVTRREDLTPEQHRTLQDALRQIQTLALAHPPKTVNQIPMAMPK